MGATTGSGEKEEETGIRGTEEEGVGVRGTEEVVGMRGVEVGRGTRGVEGRGAKGEQVEAEGEERRLSGREGEGEVSREAGAISGIFFFFFFLSFSFSFLFPSDCLFLGGCGISFAACFFDK